MEEKVFDLKKYAAKARKMAAEGIVMLRNEGDVLPLSKGAKVALFGRSQMNYYKSGTGSGGLVNVSYGKFLKFTWKLFVLEFLFAEIMLVGAVALGYGY